MKESLKKIKLTLQSLINNLASKNYLGKAITINNLTYFEYENLQELRIIINEYESLQIFEDLINIIKSSAVFQTSDNEFRVNSSEGQKINTTLKNLEYLSSNLLSVLKNTLPEEDPSSINIKLPDHVDDFDKLSKVSRDIHIAISQIVINNEINGEEKIVSVENGSIWLNVFLGGTAIPVVASLIWAAAVIRKKWLEGNIIEQQIRSLKVKNDSLEDILKAQKEQTALLIESEAKHIESEHFQAHSPENLERIKNSVTIFAELISKGAEFQPSLMAPEQVTNLFPDPKNIMGLESKIKQISN